MFKLLKCWEIVDNKVELESFVHFYTESSMLNKYLLLLFTYLFYGRLLELNGPFTQGKRLYLSCFSIYGELTPEVY